MQTDESISEQMKVERRRVFWRLYFLPWALLFLLILTMYILRGRSYRHQLATVTGESYSNGVKEVRVDAVKNGVASWVIDDTGNMAFLWRAQMIVMETTIVTQVVTQVVTQEVASVSGETNTLELTPKTYANLRNFNLEKELVRTTTESIHTVFEGLRTYDKVLGK